MAQPRVGKSAHGFGKVDVGSILNAEMPINNKPNTPQNVAKREEVFAMLLESTKVMAPKISSQAREPEL